MFTALAAFTAAADLTDVATARRTVAYAHADHANAVSVRLDAATLAVDVDTATPEYAVALGAFRTVAAENRRANAAAQDALMSYAAALRTANLAADLAADAADAADRSATLADLAAATADPADRRRADAAARTAHAMAGAVVRMANAAWN